MAKLNARKIVAGLQAEVDEASHTVCKEVEAIEEKHGNLSNELQTALDDYREKVARLDKALGQ